MATYKFDSTSVNTVEGQKSLLSKSFLYMFLFLLLTVIVSLSTSLIILNVFPSVETQVEIYEVLLLASSLTQIVLTIIIMISSIRQGKAPVVAFILYATCMGVFISSFSLYLNWWTIASAFAITAMVFGAMAIIGARSKRASALGTVGLGLLLGLIVASLFNFILMFFLPGVYSIIDVVISVLVIIAVMLITAYDVNNIIQISKMGENSSNLALYFAFNLYLDFIMILIRVLRLIVMSNSRR